MSGLRLVDRGSDEYGRLRADVLDESGLRGEVLYLRWAANLGIYEAPPDSRVQIELLGLLRAESGPLQMITHTRIHHRQTLRWYADSDLAPGVVFSGHVAGRPLLYDTVDTLPAGLLDPVEPSEEREGEGGYWPVDVTVLAMLQADLRLRGPLDVQQVAERLRDPSWLVKCSQVRALACTAGLEAEQVQALMLFALTDPMTAVRQFAALQMGGWYLDQPWLPELAGMLAAVERPLEVYGRLGGRAAALDLGRTARDVRWGVVWILSNLVTNARGVQSERLGGLPDEIQVALADGAGRWDGGRDEALALAAARELTGTELGALGALEGVGVLGVLRYLVHRRRLLARAGLLERDRYYWLGQALDGLMPKDGPARRVLLAPGPAVALDGQQVADCWLGPNPLAEAQGDGAVLGFDLDSARPACAAQTAPTIGV